MGEGGGELVASDDPPIVTETLLDAVVVEDCESDRCFADPSWTDQSDWGQVFSETNNLLNQIITSTAGPWRWGRGFTGYTRSKREISDPLIVEIPDLVWV